MRALFGLYGDYTDWNRFGGVRVAHVAGEGAYFFGQFTLEGIAGVEFGNTASSSSIVGVSNSTSSSTSQSTTIIPEVFPTPGETIVTTTTVTTSTTTITTLTESYSIKTRFFDQINLAYYPIDNWKLFVGHRYLGGLNAAALGAEYGLPLGRGIMSSAFVEARIGERDFHGIWGCISARATSHSWRASGATIRRSGRAMRCSALSTITRPTWAARRRRPQRQHRAKRPHRSALPPKYSSAASASHPTASLEQNRPD